MGEKEAFIAGFMATAEGLNGEYVGDGVPIEKAEEQYNIWACGDHEFGEWEPERTIDLINKSLYRRECVNCPYSETFSFWTSPTHPKIWTSCIRG